jgi:hypothetical protein
MRETQAVNRAPERAARKCRSALNVRFRVAVLAMGCGLSFAAAMGPDVPGIDDAALVRLMDHGGVRLPPRLFTPELVLSGKRSVVGPGTVFPHGIR